MVPLNWPLQAPSPQDMRWLRVEDASAVSACRNAVLTMAGRLEFPAARADQLALAVTEAASNLYKHARQGCLLLAVNRDAEAPGIELVTIDSGPGLPDVSAALRDGHSTAGTLGIGLGAIRRLADFCDLYSVPGHGTSLAARFWPAPRPPEIRWAGLVRPITGEVECGDAYGAVQAGDIMTAVLCDGLGHGPLAAAAAAAGVAAVLDEPAGEPAALLERAHRRMSGTRGGAVGIVQISGQVARFAGLGNIAASILSAWPPQEHALRPRNRRLPGAHHPSVRVRGAARRRGHPALRRPQQPLGGRRPAGPGDQGSAADRGGPAGRGRAFTAMMPASSCSQS